MNTGAASLSTMGWSRGQQKSINYRIDTSKAVPVRKKVVDQPLLRNTLTGLALAMSLGSIPPPMGAEVSNAFQVHTRSTYRQGFAETLSQLQKVYFMEDAQVLANYIIAHPQAHEFLVTIIQPIKSIYGEVNLSLELWTSPEDNEQHIRLMIESGIQDDEQITARENQLFEIIEGNKRLQNGLAHVVISQR